MSGFNPFSRSSWKKAARQAGQGGPADPLWFGVGIIIMIIIIVIMLQP
jgi:hypothetical protein